MIDRFQLVAGSAHAADLDRVLAAVHAHMAIQGVAWAVFLLYVLVRFRAGRQPRAQRRGIGAGLPVLAIAAVIVGDAVVLATAAIPAWAARSHPPSSATAPLEVHIVAEQFAWNVHYPGPDGRFGVTRQELIGPANPLGIDRTDPNARDDIGALNVLMLPLGRTVIVQLSSRDVIHSFTLNEMRVKQDAVPGMLTRTWFTPIVAGRWEIACSQLCGLGHYRMRGEYSILPQREWNEWLASELALVSAASGKTR